MPGEWHDHAGCWMAWPARVNLWPDIEATKKTYADVANTIADFENLKILFFSVLSFIITFDLLSCPHLSQMKVMLSIP